MNEPLSGFTFATERLAFRPLSEDDRDLCCGLYCDPDTMKFIGATLTREHALRSLERALALMRSPTPRRIFLAVEAEGGTIGLASIQHIDTAHRSAELGLMLLPHARARGYSKDALTALAQKTFELLPIDALWVEHSIEHEVAERLFRSVGFARHEDAALEAATGTRRWSLRRDDGVTK